MNNKNGYIDADTGLAALKEYTWARAWGAACLWQMTGGRCFGADVASPGIRICNVPQLLLERDETSSSLSLEGNLPRLKDT